MIFGLGVPEILLIIVVIALIFGPAVFTKMGKSAGKTVKNFREAAGIKDGDFDDDDDDEA